MDLLDEDEMANYSYVVSDGTEGNLEFSSAGSTAWRADAGPRLVNP